MDKRHSTKSPRYYKVRKMALDRSKIEVRIKVRLPQNCKILKLCKFLVQPIKLRLSLKFRWYFQNSKKSLRPKILNETLSTDWFFINILVFWSAYLGTSRKKKYSKFLDDIWLNWPQWWWCASYSSCLTSFHIFNAQSSSLKLLWDRFFTLWVT